MAILLQDNFDRANSATAIGSPQIGPAPTVLAGVGGISSNQLYAPTATMTVVWDLGTTDAELSFTYQSGTAAGRSWAIVLGGASTTDHYLVLWNGDGQVGIHRQNPGGTELQVLKPGYAPTAGVELKAHYSAGIIRAYTGGELVLRWKPDVPITSTRHGLRINNNTPRLDNLLGTDAPTITESTTTGAVRTLAFGTGSTAKTSWLYRGRDTYDLDLAGVH